MIVIDTNRLLSFSIMADYQARSEWQNALSVCKGMVGDQQFFGWFVLQAIVFLTRKIRRYHKMDYELEPVIGVMGGSGLYQMEGLEDIEEVRVDTPFGSPSDLYLTGKLHGIRMVFLARHGKGHRYLPSEVNYRANIFGMKKLGVQRIISISAVGSMKEDIVPGMIVIPDQFIDRTRGMRASTFFGEGVVGHVQVADPFCQELSQVLAEAARQENVPVRQGGTYLCIEGPDRKSVV
jgi:purine nucleoside phosphorylase